MKRVVIEVISAEEMRYPTVGDWYLTKTVFDDGPFAHEEMVDSWEEAETLQIRVAAMGDWRHEQLVADHEYNEALVCFHRGITPGDVDKFDMEYEKAHKNDDTEPGSDPQCPCYRPHIVATAIENILFGELEVNQDDYNIALDESWKKAGHRSEEVESGGKAENQASQGEVSGGDSAAQ